MKILVCVKQVPSTSQVEVDPVTGTLRRDGSGAKLNPYDLFALETAFRLREQYGGTVTALSMGPNQAVSSLLETLYMGADEAFLVSDRLFAGADVHATSYVIGMGVRKVGPFDLILCGKQTTDGDTAQVGPELAEWLGLEHAANVQAVEDLTPETVTVRILLDDLVQRQTMRLPCLLTVEKDIFTPRLPSFKRKMEIPPQAVTVFSAADLPGLDPARCGLKGSPTQVERIFPPESNVRRELTEGDGETLARAMYGLLKAGKFI